MLRFSAIRLPYPPYAWRIVRSAAWIWLGVRIAAAFVGTPLPGAGAALLIVAVSAFGAWLDLRRSHEHLFHANLGTTPAWSAGIALGTAGTLELGLQLAVRALISLNGGAILG